MDRKTVTMQHAIGERLQRSDGSTTGDGRRGRTTSEMASSWCSLGAGSVRSLRSSALLVTDKSRSSDEWREAQPSRFYSMSGHIARPWIPAPPTPAQIAAKKKATAAKIARIKSSLRVLS